MSSPVKVLLIDDSAVVRMVVAQVLAAEPGFELTTAPDPVIAAQKMARSRPDVILLDLELPRVDGLSFLRQLMANDPMPVVVLSGRAGPGTHAAIEALTLGAVDVVAKPPSEIRTFLEGAAVRLREVLRAAAGARPRGRVRLQEPPPRAPMAPGVLKASGTMICVGGSTGGPEALQTFLCALPANAPAVVAVLHMPAPFPAAYAQRLSGRCQVAVRQAEHGDRPRPGLVLLAPGHAHMRVVADAGGPVVALDEGPAVGRHRPSIDVLFHSVAEVVGRRAVGVLLTGMGADGAEGLLSLRRAGARTLAQDESTCVVFGMPREALSRGAVDVLHPLERLAELALLGDLAPR